MKKLKKIYVLLTCFLFLITYIMINYNLINYNIKIITMLILIYQLIFFIIYIYNLKKIETNKK